MIPQEIRHLVSANKLDEAIAMAEAGLQRYPSSSFHSMPGRDLAHLTLPLYIYLSECHALATAFFDRNDIQTDTFYQIDPSSFQQVEVTRTIDWSTRSLMAVYCEMNGFDINCDRWFLDFFGYTRCEDTDDRGWFSDYNFDVDQPFLISGLEDIQEAYRQLDAAADRSALQPAADACSLLIVLRLQQLFQRVYLQALDQNAAWAATPIFVTAHDWDLIYKVAI